MKQKPYTTFPFFKAAVAITLIALAGALVAEYFFQIPVLVPVVSVAVLAFAVFTFRIVQLIYKDQRFSIHDVNQVESLMWLYSRFTPSISFPPMRVVAGSPDFLKVVADHCFTHQPKVIVEASSGVSSMVISEVLLHQSSPARHVALEHMIQYVGESSSKINNPNSEIAYSPLTDYTIGGKTWKWYDMTALADISEIDLLVVDGPPENIQSLARFPALPLLWDKLSAHATIILDDTNRPDEQAIIRQWTAQYPLSVEKIYTEKGTTILRRTNPK